MNDRDHSLIVNLQSAIYNLQSALIWLAVLPLLWVSLVLAPPLRVEVGEWGDHAYLDGIHAIEQSSTENYRWTTEHTALTLPNIRPADRLLHWRGHGWRPAGQPTPQVQISAEGQALGPFTVRPEVRHYRVLLPPATGLNRQITFDSTGYSPPGDPRRLGIALDWLALTPASPASAGLWQFAGQALLLGLLLLLVGLLALPGAASLPAGLLLVGALLAANWMEPLWVGAALGPWLLISLVLIGATLWLAPGLAGKLPNNAMYDVRCMMYGKTGHDSFPSVRSVPSVAKTTDFWKYAWALLVLAFGLRLFGAVHPLFNSHDVDVHMRWLDTVASGQWYLYSTPSEARGRQIFNPPAGYTLLLPLGLALPSTRLVVQIGTALIDGLGCLLLLLIARELRLPARAGLLALALYLALPLNTTILWWGFATNIISQALWLLLLWLLLRLLNQPDRAGLALLAVASAAALLTHIGALALTLAASGLLVVLALPRVWQKTMDGGRWTMGSRGTIDCAAITFRPPSAASRLLLVTLTLVLTALALVPLYFSAALAPLLGSADSALLANVGEIASGSRATPLDRLGVLAVAISRAYPPLLLSAAGAGLASLLIARPVSWLLRPTLLAWAGASLLFLAMHLATGFLTRYIYFAAPLLCLAAGALLAALWQSRAGRWASTALVLAVAWGGTLLWLQGVLLRIKPSALPLSH